MVKKASGSRVFDEPEPGDSLIDKIRGETVNVTDVSDETVTLEDSAGSETVSKKDFFGSVEHDILEFSE